MTSDEFRPQPGLTRRWWLLYGLGIGISLTAAYLWVVVG
jgi:hypothetical protein